MTQRPIYLIDQDSAKVAVLNVELEEGLYQGVLSLALTPPALRELFEEFEEIVEGQMLSLLDGVEEKIASVPLRVVFENGDSTAVTDLQVYSSTGSVSFRTRQPADSELSPRL